LEDFKLKGREALHTSGRDNNHPLVIPGQGIISLSDEFDMGERSPNTTSKGRILVDWMVGHFFDLTSFVNPAVMGNKWRDAY
jgi:hypothetical protein